MPFPSKRNSSRHVTVCGARTHNLKSIDVKIPYYRLTSFCGLSGSGKTTLALDVLYAEGRRRYAECFSVYARQFLDNLEKPDADLIEGIPPAVAVASHAGSHTSNETVGTATEADSYLQALFSKIGVSFCRHCGRKVRRDSPETVARALTSMPEGTRALVALAPSPSCLRGTLQDFVAEWLGKGFHRGVINGKRFDLNDPNAELASEYQQARLWYLDFAQGAEEDVYENLGVQTAPSQNASQLKNDVESDDEDLDELHTKNGKDESGEIKEEEGGSEVAFKFMMLSPDGENLPLKRYVENLDKIERPVVPPIFFIVNRITIGKTSFQNAYDSIETAFTYGEQRCWAFVEGDQVFSSRESDDEERVGVGTPYAIDGVKWTRVGFSRNMRCEDCGVDVPDPTPNLFNFRSQSGRCPVCGGAGQLTAFDEDRIFPNKSRSIFDGAIAPWNCSPYKGRLRKLLEIADDLGIRVDVPFSELTRAELATLYNGSGRLGFEGLNGFFNSLLKEKYKMHIRTFLSRWQTMRVCPMCNGARLRRDALCVKIEGKNVYDLTSAPTSETLATLDSWNLDDGKRQIGAVPLLRARARLAFLKKVGLGYLPLDRAMRTLSSGEARRVELTSALGSDLVDMLYVLDEPTVGLHPSDSENLLQTLYELRDRGNTLLVVDHNETILNASDHIVEIGPGAGEEGGNIVFEGTPEELKASPTSLTGSYLSGRRIGGGVPKRRIFTGEKGDKFIELVGATGYNLKNVDVVFPLRRLCVVTGVSGAGKSALVQETLYPALCTKLGGGDPEIVANGLPYKEILGAENVDDVALIDQTPIGRSPRSNAVTYLKIFDDIRALYAETPDARAMGLGAGAFSFNVEGGRCDYCKGEGFVQIDMQYMSDVFVKCPVCEGRRYQKHVLEVLYRGRNIAETLEMTAREAFGFFRGQPKIQQKLKRMLDVGLDYLRLGQPANTLSGGEAQRLKLAAFLSTARKGPCLFIMDEPTSGLHFADVVRLLDQLNALIETGNSVVVVEHNPLVIRAADYVVDLGPGAGNEGGAIVAEGTPEQVSANPNSKTGVYVAKALGLR